MRSLLLAAITLASPALAQNQDLPLFARYPDVSADQITFVYAGDLWLVPREGGVARPLTSAPGPESLPKFNPAGDQVAFIGDYDGGQDIYVVAVDGGVPDRLTFHPGRETLCSWSPDGQNLLFHSSRESGQARAPKVFQVPRAGGQATALPQSLTATSQPWMPRTNGWHTRRHRASSEPGNDIAEVWLKTSGCST